MNFTIVKTLNCRNGKQPIHLRKLTTLLNDLGVPFKRRNGQKVQLGRKFSVRELWSKFESARKVYFERIRQIHPDRGGDWKLCAELNAVWLQIKMLFGRLGIGVNL